MDQKDTSDFTKELTELRKPEDFAVEISAELVAETELNSDN